MNQSRRDFIGSAVLSAGAAVCGCATVSAAKPQVRDGDCRALLLHLGHNMWCSWPSEYMEPSAKSPSGGTERRSPDLRLRCRDDIWRRVTDHAVATGVNMIVIDLGEGVVYPSHPELAIEGSWSADKLRDELARLRSLGVEVVPKLNFSTTHNGWMKDFQHMVASRPYHRFCEEVIRDALEIFDGPRFFHIGFDEETARHQEHCDSKYISVRRGEFWWQDFLQVVRTVEKGGARAWMWSDFCWDNEEFFSRCPKSVVQQNWFYDECHGGFDPATNKTDDLKRLKAFEALDKAGFDQVPCGTNWVGWKRRSEKCGADDVIGKLVDYGRRTISPERLKGFMMAPWAPCDTEKNEAFIKRGTDLFAAALGGRSC